MKYVIVLADGMADYPLDDLGGRTPLQYATTPFMDRLAASGEVGMVQTIPAGMPPGSDTANLSVLGYDPRVYYSGRSPLEAASMNVAMDDGDCAFRCNLVTLSAGGRYEERTMLDHSAGEITSAEARELINDIAAQLATGALTFYPGVSYRHLLLWRSAPQADWQLTPPHDIIGQVIGCYLPQGGESRVLRQLMRRGAKLLAGHQINRRREARGQRPANAIWIWGEGRKPQLPSFYDRYGLRGGVISAVDLIRGLGILIGLQPLDVPGATGNMDSNLAGKAAAALEALSGGYDFIYIHIEAPDEAGHRQELHNKIKAIERIDSEVVGRLFDGLAGRHEPFRMMILPDHATPLSLRTHTDDPVPFLIFDAQRAATTPRLAFDEQSARASSLYFADGAKLIEYFVGVGEYAAG